jgi:hypothetical protein
MDEQLVNAVKNNNYDEVSKLLNQEDTHFKCLDSCLIIACRENCMKIVKKLLEKGANIDNNDGYCIHFALHNIEILKLLLQNEAKTCMFHLYHAPNEKTINLLFSYGAVFDEKSSGYDPFNTQKNKLLEKLWNEHNIPDAKYAGKKK